MWATILLTTTDTGNCSSNYHQYLETILLTFRAILFYIIFLLKEQPTSYYGINTVEILILKKIKAALLTLY